MNKPSDLNVRLNPLDHEEQSSVFPDLPDKDLLSFLKLSTELAADEVFWMKSDSEIFYVNNAACQKLGYERSELIGMRVWEWDPLFPKKVWPTFWAELKEKRHVDFETQHQNKNGKIFPVRIRGHFLQYGEEEILFAYVSDISDIKEQESKLKIHSEQLESLVETRTAELAQEKKKFEEFVNLAPVGIAINSIEDGRFIYINKEFSRFTGYSIDELNEMDYWQLTPKKYESQEQKQLNDMAEQGRYGPYQKEYIHKAGHHYPVLLSGIKITDLDEKDYIWSVVQDVSDQKKNEVEIREAKERADSNAFRMKLANDSAGIGVWEWDLTTNALVWDEWMYKLYGIPKDRFSGAYEAWENSVHPDDKEYAVSKLEQAIAGEGVYEPEIRVVWPSGEIRVMKASAEVIRDKEGNALKMVGVNYDVTDRVRALESASRAKQDAENAARAKSDFLANMSHEIRTPMNGVVGMLQVLKRTELTKEQHEQLSIAVSSADSLLVLINDILDFSKIEAGRLSIESIEFSLLEQINGVVDTVSHLIHEDSEVELVVETKQINSRNVIGDPVRLRQIITNLVSNAIKFTESGEIRLKASLEESTHSKWCFRCSVKDTGIGIESENLKGLFSAFTQADVSTTRKYGGTGLGLSICKKLCELMGGSITATSEPGKGSCFAFEIELGKATQENLQLKSSTKDEPDTQLLGDLESKQQKILLVEDNKVNQLVAEHMLLQMGLKVDICANGVEAIDTLKSGLYSLVLMDCQMPEMDGYEATRRIRQGEAGERYKHIPIIAMTANAMQGDRDICIEAGMNDYISKPVEESIIRSMLSKIIGSS